VFDARSASDAFASPCSDLDGCGSISRVACNLRWISRPHGHGGYARAFGISFFDIHTRHDIWNVDTNTLRYVFAPAWKLPMGHTLRSRGPQWHGQRIWLVGGDDGRHTTMVRSLRLTGLHGTIGDRLFKIHSSAASGNATSP